MHPSRFALLGFIFVGSLISFDPTDLMAQSEHLSMWPSEAESRLKDIYDRGAFRAPKPQVDWFLDSSGYIVQERNPANDTTSEASYAVQTGQRTEMKPRVESNTGRRDLRSPDRKKVLEFRDRDLFVRDIDSEHRIQLTSRDSKREISYRNPLWSPDGRRIAFVESDVTEVLLRSVLTPDDPSYPGVQKNRFARVGGEIEKLRVGIVEVDGTHLRWLDIPTPKEGIYLGQIEWAGNPEELLIEKLSRFRDQRDFLLANIHGEVKRIYHESNEAWAESSQGKNSGLVWIKNGKEFIVLTEKDGWRHAFRWSREGKELALLTPGDYDVIDRGAVDEATNGYYFYASPKNGTEKYLYRVSLDGSDTLKRITPDDKAGTHNYDFSPDMKWAIHSHSTIDMPPIVDLVTLPEHRVVRVLDDHAALHAKMESIHARPTEFIQLDIDNGVSMDAWMIKPKGFDPTKKYPVFVYVYGEPHAQTVLNEWGAAHVDFHRVVADLGYIVLSIDNRGTPAPKGAAWRRSIYGSLGPLSTEEQEAGLKEFAKTRPYVDLSRVGIWGWSGGGSNTLNALFRKPDSYHVGIAVVPKPQPHLYNAWFQEIFMRTRELNPDGYHRAAAINYAEGLKGKLLIITGSGETNTHIQIIEGLVDKLIALGKPFDYMVYPNRDHGLREGIGTNVHVRMRILRYLLENLPPGPR